MIARLRLLFIFIIIGIQLQAQQLPVIEVPDEIEFAGMQLKLTRGAKEILQKDIALLTKNAKYFQTKIDRANLYFPIIEKVFEEESFPKDFKYLALQESSLISDAVSKSNAVGYWQFKKESAVEVGLRVDNKVDERMNIISSSRGAARYLKRNNQTFDNWVYSLLSYNLGLGGAKSQIDAANIGVQKMTIDENMHWYVVRFLAHKLIYQNAVGNASTVDTVLVQYINGANKTLHDIASEYNLDLTSTLSYNKWLKIDHIPEDKIYPVVLAMPMAQAKVYVKTSQLPEASQKENKKKEKFPSIADINLNTIGAVAYTFIVNGVKAIMAKSGDNIVRLATKGGISKEEFLKYNEMRSFDDITPGKIYYLDNKKNRAMVMFHTVQYNETLWDIAQNYGMKSETIREKNRMEENEALVPGRVLWLRTKRPKGKPVEYKAIEHPKPTIKETTPPQPIIIDTAITKTEELKQADNIFEHNNTSANPFIIDSINNSCTFHEVISGETLFGISRKYQVATDTLMRWNNMNGYGIKLGQILLVGYKSKTSEPIVHTVITGDTYYKIARQYNVSVAEIQQWNNRADMNLKLGEKLVIRKNQP